MSNKSAESLEEDEKGVNCNTPQHLGGSVDITALTIKISSCYIWGHRDKEASLRPVDMLAALLYS